MKKLLKLKKDQGINLQFLTNREKAIIINALRDSHQLKELLEILNMAKSSYFYQVIAINTDKYVDLRAKIKDAFNEASSRYGYRRIHSVIKSAGTTVSEKVVRRIMKEENLMVPNIKRKKYSSYKGEISPEVESWIKRMEKAELTRSMSKKGCSPDNSACEGFFGRLKNEMFYGYSWTDVTIDQFIEQLNKYIKWYAEKRIKLSLGGMSPLDYRRSLGLVV